MTVSQNAPLAEIVREVYLQRRSGAIEIERSSGRESLFFRQGELHLHPSHAAARTMEEILSGGARERPAADSELFRATVYMAHELIRDRHATARFRVQEELPLRLLGPLPTVVLAMELASHGLVETELVERLGGESCCYQASNETPALQQLPSLEPEMAQVLVSLVQPVSLGGLLRGARGDRMGTLRGLARLRAVGLVVEVGGGQKSDPEGADALLSPRLLQHFLERVGEGLDGDPLTLPTAEHRQRIADLLSQLGKMTHYELLGIGLKTTEDEVLRAYNQLARVVHPRHAARLGLEGREEAIRVLFEQATEAYLALSDPRRRASYNMIAGIQITTEVDADQREEEKRQIAKQNYRRAASCLAEADYSLAADLLKEAVRLDPQAVYFARLGQVQTKNPHWYRHAMESYRRALELAPDDAGVRVAYAESLEAMDRADEARHQYKAALELMPNHPKALDALERLGKR